MTEYVPYTYLIGWSSLDLWYYGVQYSKRANPNNLWSTYFTSSKYVRDARLEYGEPDVVQVRKIFLDRNSARLWEHQVLKRLNVRKNKKWLNKSDNLHHYSDSPRIPWNKGKPMSDEQKCKLSELNMGKTLSVEHRRKMSEVHKNRDHSISMEIRERISKSNLGKTVSDSTKEKMRLAKLGVKKQTKMCPYCDTYVAPNMFSRWHGKNCKHFTY